jgi:Xaa-Pro aminopeptidase
LDALSRQFLWNEGFDFGHGVGHGVGHFLNVHEYPPSIGYRKIEKINALKLGMVVTIEPGYCKDSI